MTWNPELYNAYQAEREQPFYDLIGHLKVKGGLQILDLGCGTGNLTKVLAGKFPESETLGIDSSIEMLEKSNNADSVHFELKTIEKQLQDSKQWDVIVSNAALQWLNDHEKLFPIIFKKLKPGGQLAVQMPNQKQNMLNVILQELASEEPYANALKHWNPPSSVLTIDAYSKLIFENGGTNLIAYQKVYPIISKHENDFYEFIAGSALVPYLEKIAPAFQTDFIQDYKKRISKHFPKVPSIYAFQRILLYASF